jgi:signal transduction histidine kinase
MQDAPDAPVVALTSGRAVEAQFERERQIRFIQSVAPLLARLAAILALCILLFARFSTTINTVTLVLTAALVALGAAGTGAATIVAQRNQERLAANLVPTSVGAALVLVCLMWIMRQGLDPVALLLLALLILPTALTGLLVTVPALLIALVGSNILTVLCVLAGTHNAHTADIFRHNAALYTVVLLLFQWASAGLILAVRQNYQTTIQELSHLYTQIRQVDEIKDQFITSVNHELRNPIMALTGYVEIMRLRQRQMTEDRRAEVLDQASQVGDRVSHLLESILDARRLDQGADKFTPAVVNVREAITAAAQLLDPREATLQGDALHIDVPDDLVIWGEATRLQQVLTNLLSNAIKYSPPGTPVDVSAAIITEPLALPRFVPRGLPTEHHMVEITVRDHGLGIPEGQGDLLFRRFVRLPRDLASTTIGNGLGLFLCKVFVEAMRGRIWLESSGTPGDGTAFHFTLPLPPDEYMLADGSQATLAGAGEQTL